tara:strand:- start:653 stop:1123 length:471 start_codon:yes stop_codon:yes gene_type:complete
MRNHDQDITNLLFTYTERFDLGDFEGAADIFKHAKIIIGSNGETINSQGLLENWRSMVVVYESGTPRTKHVCTNAIVDVDLDNATATSRSYYIVYQQTKVLPFQPIVAGRYVDKFELVADQWRFSERDYRLMEMVGNISKHLCNSEAIMAQRKITS